MPRQTDYSRSPATQPYRTTNAAQLVARRLRVTDDGRAVTLRPLADILSPRTRATLDAINGGRTNGRR